MEKMQILVVDDDREIAGAIAKLLRLEGFEAIEAHDGREALNLMEQEDFKLVIMDIMMPQLDGLSATIRIRDSKNIPIIMLSAKSEDSDKILGLSMGADDYVTKPFSPQELIARVKSQLRRYVYLGSEGQSKLGNKLVIGGLCIDMDAKALSVDGEPARLTPTEYKIVELLMSNAGVVFSADQIMKESGKNSLIQLRIL